MRATSTKYERPERGGSAMDIAAVLKRSNVRCEVSAGSKKHALELLSEALADAIVGEGPTAAEVLEGLVSRERLGSTGLGRAVAMPHARVPGLGSSIAAFLKLAEAIDFGSPDGQPVDLLFGLLVPEESTAMDEETIRVVVDKLRDPQLQQKLRSSEDPAAICRLLVDSLAAQDAAR